MKLKGSMKIELTDVNTGEVNTVKHDNMMTDAVSNVLGLNLLRALSIAAVAGLVSVLTSLASLDVICEDTEYADAYDDYEDVEGEG